MSSVYCKVCDNFCHEDCAYTIDEDLTKCYKFSSSNKCECSHLQHYHSRTEKGKKPSTSSELFWFHVSTQIRDDLRKAKPLTKPEKNPLLDLQWNQFTNLLLGKTLENFQGDIAIEIMVLTIWEFAYEPPMDKLKERKTFKIKCPVFERAVQFMSENFPNIIQDFHNSSGDYCFCEQCGKQRGDKIWYERGQPPKKYILPVGWCRIGLDIDPVKTEVYDVWNKWHVSYHGTRAETISKIQESGFILLKSGDATATGDILTIRDDTGRIRKQLPRINIYSKKDEIFDPNQIFSSPSLLYSSLYATKQQYSLNGQNVQAQFLFQLRQRPNSYNIGQNTTIERNIDPNVDDNEIEWYTKNNLAVVVQGLLIRLVDIRPLKVHSKSRPNRFGAFSFDKMMHDFVAECETFFSK